MANQGGSYTRNEKDGKKKLNHRTREAPPAKAGMTPTGKSAGEEGAAAPVLPAEKPTKSTK